MEFRKATEADLPEIKALYRLIIRTLKERGTPVWDDDYYPCEVFIYDIRASRLFVLTDDGGRIVAGCAIMDAPEYDTAMDWEDTKAVSRCLERLGSHPDTWGTGTGHRMMECAKEEAKRQGAEYLRLFANHKNAHAMHFYERSGMRKAPGIHLRRIDEELTLTEYGYEIKLR